MKKEEEEMLERIFDTETIGYACLYPAGGGMRQESLVAATPENLANYIGSHFLMRRRSWSRICVTA